MFPPPPAAESLTEADRSRLVATGTFIHANPSDPVHWGRGKVSVYERTVFLEADFKVGPGPKYHVYLVPKAQVRSEADVKSATPVDLGRLRSFEGSQRYPIPESCQARRLQERGDLVRAVQCANFARRSLTRSGP